MWCDAVLFGRNVLTVLVKLVASILHQKGRGNGFFRNSCYCLSNSVTSLTLSASSSPSSLLLQPQIAHLRSTFQYKLNRQTDEGRLFYLKEHYNIMIVLCKHPNNRKERKTNSLINHTFLEMVRPIH